MRFISKFILPKEVDFGSALLVQTWLTRTIVEDLHKACVDNDANALHAIAAHANKARALKAKNMAELLLQDDIKRIFIHKDILAQLKEIAKRLHVTANTVEDMALKIV